MCLTSDTSKSTDAPAGRPPRCLRFYPAAHSAREFIKKKSLILIPSVSSSCRSALRCPVLDTDTHSPHCCRAPHPSLLARSARHAHHLPGRPKPSASGGGAHARCWCWMLVVLAHHHSPPALPLPYFANICFKCFRLFRGMLQSFHMDVANIDWGDVAYVLSVSETCCKSLFKMFHLF
jgi:hypothetical protein